MNIKRFSVVVTMVPVLLLLGAGGLAAQGNGQPQAASVSAMWYMAEGCTDFGMETWLLLENPWTDQDSTVEITFVTESGASGSPLDLVVPVSSRRTINVGSYLVSGQASAIIHTTAGHPVYAERAMYGNGRTWGTATMGSPGAIPTWYFAEGCTAGGMETWLLVLNPSPTDAVVDIDLANGSGPIGGFTGQTIPANSRSTFNLGESVTDYDLSATVTATTGTVVCERTMFGGERAWATCSVGAPQAAITWNFAEGCTAGGMETWLLVANPGDKDALFGVDFYSGGVKTSGPAAVDLPAHTRRSVNVRGWINSYEVSSIVTANESIVCERTMFGGERTWATSTTAFGSLATSAWQFPEGCTRGGFETWLIVFNPTATDTAFTVTLFDIGGVPVDGPQNVPLPAKGRVTLKMNEYLAGFDASFWVSSNPGGVVCERTMFGGGRSWATGSVGIPGGPL